MAPTEPNSNPVPIRAWPQVLLLIAMAIGVAIGIYMTWHHDSMLYGTGDAQIVGCAETRVVSCDEVNTSRYSEVLGVPIAIFTAPTYFLVALLSLMALLRRGDPRRLIRYNFGIGLLAVLYSVFLGIVSRYELGFICLWCFRLYALNLSIAVLSWISWGRNPLPMVKRTLRELLRWPREMRLAGLALLALCLLSFGGERLYRQSLLGDAPTLAALSESDKTGFNEDFSLPCPQHSWQVRTEDKHNATLSTEPDDPWRGNRDASVVVVKFSDFPCPYCKKLSTELGVLYHHYGDRVLFVEKNYPMNPKCNPGVKNTLHREACDAQKAGACAHLLGHYWDYYELVYKNNHQLSPNNLVRFAVEVGMDRAAFAACFKGPDGLSAVFKDAEHGASLDLHGVPRLFIDGKLYRAGQSAAAIAARLELALGADKAEAERRAMGLVAKAPEADPIADDVPEMTEIRQGDLHFFMDTFEASIAEDGRATSGVGRVPGYRLSWYQARNACQAAGKRLCSEREWVAVCQGAPPVDDDSDGAWADDIIEGSTYPYGDRYLEGTCYTGHNREGSLPVYTGSMPACRSADGVYDLVGNMEEWVGLDEDHAVLLGGAFDTKADKGRCYRRDDTFGPGYIQLRHGFRCCRDAG